MTAAQSSSSWPTATAGAGATSPRRPVHRTPGLSWATTRASSCPCTTTSPATSRSVNDGSAPSRARPGRTACIRSPGQRPADPDDLPLFPYYWMKSFVRHLDKAKRSWRWYSYDPGTLRFIDHKYRLRRDTNFAFVEQRTPEEEIQGQILSEGSSLIDDIANDTLPDVSWIDPNFTDLHLYPHSNDDHPPADVTAGQEL